MRPATTFRFLLLNLILPTVLTKSPPYSLEVSSTSPYSLKVIRESDSTTIVDNSAVLAGVWNTTATPITVSSSGEISNDGGRITATMLTSTIAKVRIDSTLAYTGARFTDQNAHFYGVWEYGRNNNITNDKVSFDLKGFGAMTGTNYANARAPFFFSSSGYGVYTDTLKMGSYNFTTPGETQFIFNSSSLVYYIILPESEGDFKSVLTQYGRLSSTIEMQAISGYGPTFWSDNFNEGWPEGVGNAQEMVYDVVNQLYYNEIKASSFFLDRPYGTGTGAWGNFDFDTEFYPTPKEFIANLSSYGFDLQVWVANRANEGTQLYNISQTNGWLFTGVKPEQGQGPALNLSIPEAYDYFKEHLSAFAKAGVKGYKIDRGEENEMPVFEQNIQMTLFEKLCYETMTEAWGAPSKTRPGKFYTFARSAVDRSRQHVGIWNGDTQASFTGLSYSIGTGIRSGLIGFPVWGSDTGGFRRSSGIPSEEVWARWMWFSAFSPVYEIMVGQSHSPWYAPYSSKLVQVLKQTADLHHELLPFIQSYIYQATSNGLPLIRALFLEAPNDKSVYTREDEYFFGEEFLIAPIRASGGSKTVYFPVGFKYLEYFNKTTVYEGGTTATVTHGLDSMPAYVREGSIVPRGDIFQGNNKWTKNWKPNLTVEVYPGFGVKQSTFRYFVEGRPGTANIVMKTNETNKVVSVQYPDLGVEGTLVVYTKTGEKRYPLKKGGAKVQLSQVETLFD